jgi:hypothetical protein
VNRKRDGNGRFGEVRMRDLTKPEFTKARISVNRAFDAWCDWQQRLRRLINEAETYSPEAFEVSLREVRGGMRNADIDVAAMVWRFDRLTEGEAHANQR